MNPAEIFSLVGSRMKPNENGYNRCGNRTYAHVRSDNSEIDLASICYHFPCVLRGPFYIESGNISMTCNVVNIIYFAVNNEGSNKSDYFPNPRELLPWRFNITFGLKIRWQLEIGRAHVCTTVT